MVWDLFNSIVYPYSGGNYLNVGGSVDVYNVVRVLAET
jgi:hypothetical protein